MSPRRFFVPRESLQGDTIVLPPDQAHHLRDVLRMQPGDAVEIIDGEGGGYTGTLQSCIPVVVGSLRPITGERARPSVLLAATLLKTDHFDWMLQKATELGADEFIPLTTRYCEARIPAGRIPARLERWRRIVREASLQCRRLRVPQVHPPMSLTEFLAQRTRTDGAKLLFHEAATSRWRGGLDTPRHFVLCVGPEGGWHSSELAEAREAGFLSFSLGPRVLRAETAAVAAVTLVCYHLEADPVP